MVGSRTDEPQIAPLNSPPSGPAFDHRQEIRFAVVMYGGVSLAIYMYGIAQELLDTRDSA